MIRSLLLVMTLVLAGCGSPGEATRYYLINPVIEDTGASTATAIQVVNLDLSQYLEKFQIASRRSDNQLVFAASHQWAEAPRKNVTRAFARNLSNYLGTSDVSTPNNRSTSTPDFRISLFIERFERNADGYVILLARWQISNASGTTLATQTSDLTSDHRITATDYGGTVSALSDLLGELTKQIGNEIKASQ